MILLLTAGMILISSATVWAADTVIQSWNFDTDPGWTISGGEWQFGIPAGGGGTYYGGPDPTSGHTGSNVYGVNLLGDYSTQLGGPYYVTSGPINCVGHSRVLLRFWRWLNSDYQPFVYTMIEVSNDGTNWTTVWNNGQSETRDLAWTQVSYNISSVAADQPTVYVRWGYWIGSYGAWPYSGWNIDDVEIIGRETVVYPGFRGLWADAFHAGFKSASEIDTLVSRAVEGNYNAIIAEVLAYHDTGGGGHGAYWSSDIVPRASDNGGLDSLGYLVEKAHKNNIEVHPWLVTYRVCTTWPPYGNTFLAAHPEYFMVPIESMGQMGSIGNKCILDPGSPDVQEYLISIVKELVNKYAIDGIHWDYIRYETTNAGYPTDLSYPRSGLARFRRLTGYEGTPPPVEEPSWDDFRRREITELIRRVRAEIAAIPHSRQPLRHTASLITWGNAPADFADTSAYKNCYQDWRMWMEQGYLDAACPMVYYREHCHSQWYRNWIDACIDWKYARHMFCGQATYLNSMDNSTLQLDYANEAGVDGALTYSYAANRATETICDDSDPWTTDPSWFPYVAAASFYGKVSPPTMPWRNPQTATEGTLYGRVLDSLTGEPIDHALVQVGSLPGVTTDGNGYYVVTMIPAVASGTAYDVTASTLLDTRTHNGVMIAAGGIRRSDFFLGPLQPPTVAGQPMPASACPGLDAAFSVIPSGEEVSVLWHKDGLPLEDGAHYAGTTTEHLTLTAIDAGHVGAYSCLLWNDAGAVQSNPASLTLKPITAVTNEPQDVGVPLRGDAQFTVLADGVQLQYQWLKNGVPLDESPRIQGVTTTTLSILDVVWEDLATYSCLVTGECGSDTSQPAELHLSFAPGDFDTDGDVDAEDFGMLQACLSGVGVAQNDPNCRKTRLDSDTDVDGDDVEILLRCFKGPEVTVLTSCAGR